jgi:PKHD-type hydroxylase
MSSLLLYWTFKDVLSDEQIDLLKSIANKEGLTSGTLQDDTVDETTRKSSISWIEYNNLTKDIFDNIWKILKTTNEDYNFDINWLPPLQYTEYDSQSSDKYDYHLDIGDDGNALYRKLSLVVMLAGKNDYKGGVLNLFCGGSEPTEIRLDKGEAIVFPSYMLHNVTEVTEGKRISLVGWVQGEKPFR